MLDHIVEPLGVTPSRQFAYFVKSLRAIWLLTPSQHRKADLLAMATESDWIAAINLLPFETQSTLLTPILLRGDFTGDYRLEWEQLAGSLMAASRNRGEFDPAIGRGRGLWRDPDGTIAFNTGREKHIYFDGKSDCFDLEKLVAPAAGNQFRYLSGSPPAIAPATKPTTTEEAQRLREAFGLFDWQNPERDPVLLVGWITCALIFNLLGFRPHIALTAQRGAGKSTVVGFIVRLIGDETNCLHIEADATSEAGLRQTLSYDALPVIADEFETNTKHATALLQLFRLASNPAAGRILKGSADGTPQGFKIRTIGLVAGITINFENAADATRFAVIELVRQHHSEKQRADLIEAFDPFDADFGARLAQRMLEKFGRLEQNLSVFRTAIRARGGDDRQADLYGSLLAGYWTACYDDVATTEQANNVTAWFEAEREDDQDERDCLNHLLGFKPYGENATIAEYVQIAAGYGALRIDDTEAPSFGETEAARILERHGMKVDGERLLIANRTPGIEQVFQITPWRKHAHGKRLKRLGGTSDGNKAHKFLGVASKVTALPFSLVFPQA